MRGMSEKWKHRTFTPEQKEAFRIPLLRALVEFGGEATSRAVTDRVGEMMAGILNRVDREQLKSRRHQIRWRNTVSWARKELLEDGLLERSDRVGVWKISSEGRRWLAQTQRAAS